MNKHNVLVTERAFVYVVLLAFCFVCWSATIKGCIAVANAAGSTECEHIKDADQRHYCRAVTSHDPLECELIKSRDLRAQCRALAGTK